MAVGLSVRLSAHPDPRGEDVSLRLVLPLHLVVRVTPCLPYEGPRQHRVRERGRNFPIYRDMQNFPHSPLYGEMGTGSRAPYLTHPAPFHGGLLLE